MRRGLRGLAISYIEVPGNRFPGVSFLRENACAKNSYSKKKYRKNQRGNGHPPEAGPGNMSWNLYRGGLPSVCLPVFLYFQDDSLVGIPSKLNRYKRGGTKAVDSGDAEEDADDDREGDGGGDNDKDKQTMAIDSQSLEDDEGEGDVGGGAGLTLIKIRLFKDAKRDEVSELQFVGGFARLVAMFLHLCRGCCCFQCDPCCCLALLPLVVVLLRGSSPITDILSPSFLVVRVCISNISCI